MQYLPSLEKFKTSLCEFLKAYAWILFTNKPIIGVIFIAASFYQFNIGLSGLIAAITAAITVRLLKFTYASSGIHVFNALLVGLSLGAFYQLEFSLLLIIITSAILTVLVTAMLMNLFLKFDSLPVLTAPFVIVALTMAFATKSFGNLSTYIATFELSNSVLPASIDAFFIALGSIFFQPYPIVGFILFCCILWQSRYLAILCIAGFIIGYHFYDFLSANQHPNLIIYNGFNFSLTTMAIGAIYAVPCVSSFLIACLAAAIAALITAATQSFMALHGLPVMALPFILTTITVLSALNARNISAASWLRLTTPDLPEKHYESARLACARLGDLNSVPILPPFYGVWTIYQGFNDRHTHQAPWQHALDFIIQENNISYSSSGKYLEDYYCYGLPVHSPVHGVVTQVNNALTDNIPGEVDTINNWGNYILIKLESNLFVLLAHLKQNSIKVSTGATVSPGDVLASVGNSGRSPQPHLHMQVQRGSALGSATYPFHLSNIALHHSSGTKEFKLAYVPKTLDVLSSLENDASIAKAMHLPVGRELTYQCKMTNKIETLTLQVQLTLLGEFRIVSNRGASFAFSETNGFIAFYDRQGPTDIFLDSWVLSVGLTPFAHEVAVWQDKPSANLLPLSGFNKLLYLILFPLGAGLDSSYERHKSEDKHRWIQHSTHRLRIGAKTWIAENKAMFSKNGCEEILMNFENQQWHLTLVTLKSGSDVGINSTIL